MVRAAPRAAAAYMQVASIARPRGGLKKLD
jgi:hypothetical protein